MEKIDSILSPTQLGALREAYKPARMKRLLSSGIPNLDADTAGYIEAIRKAFYDQCSRHMEPKDRERCLIAVLASRDGGLNLALHVYAGLMEQLSPDDIADTVFLAGIYTGVDRISDGLATVANTLAVLRQLADRGTCTVEQVATALVLTFRPPPPKLPESPPS